MSSIISVPIVAPPNTVEVSVDFFDMADKVALQQSALGAAFSQVPCQLKVPTSDLLAYYLYYKKQPGIPGYSTHGEVANRWAEALYEFNGQLAFSNTSIRVVQNAILNTGTRERVGEAIGLAVASKLHQLHQADWARIPIRQTKSMDFIRPWFGSDGHRYVQIETKGSSVNDNTVKSGPIRKHRRDIKDKKTQVRQSSQGSSSVMYGTIGVVDSRTNSIARCWLVDPPVTDLENPRRSKIVNRLAYIAALISLISPRSVLASALQTRLATLENLRDIDSLDRVVLRRGNGGEFSEITYSRGREHNPFFESRSVLADGPVGGDVSVMGKEAILFIGIQEQLISLASRQDFDALIKYAFDSGIQENTLRCVVPAGRFKKHIRRFLKGDGGNLKESYGYVTFERTGIFYYCQSGLVFGVLPI